MRNGRGVAHELGELAASVKSAHKRLDGVNKRLDGMGKSLGLVEKATARIEGALELRPATVLPVVKNGTAPNPEAALSAEDRAALAEGRAWRGLGPLLATARKNLLAVLAILLLLVVGFFQIRAALRSSVSPEEFRRMLHDSMAFVGPVAPRQDPTP